MLKSLAQCAAAGLIAGLAGCSAPPRAADAFPDAKADATPTSAETCRGMLREANSCAKMGECHLEASVEECRNLLPPDELKELEATIEKKCHVRQ